MTRRSVARATALRAVLAAALCLEATLAQAQPAVVRPLPPAGGLSGFVVPIQADDCRPLDASHVTILPTGEAASADSLGSPPTPVIRFAIVADGEVLGRVPEAQQAQQVVKTIAKYGLTQRCLVGRGAAHPMVYYKAHGAIPLHQGEDGRCYDYRMSELLYVDAAYGDWVIIFGPHEQVSQHRARGDLVQNFGPVSPIAGGPDPNHDNALAGLAVLRKQHVTRVCVIGAVGEGTGKLQWYIWLR